MLPKSILIGGVRWKIRELVKMEEKGYAEEDELRITICKKLSDENKRLILLHEVLHACVSCGGEEKKTYTEEEFILRIQAPLLGFLKTYSFKD